MAKIFSSQRNAFTLIEALSASAVLFITLAFLYGAMSAGRGAIFHARQRMDAEAIAFDKAMEVFNGTNFPGILVATNLQVEPVPEFSVLPAGSEIRVGIFPNIDTLIPYKWDIEVKVKQAFIPGSPAAATGSDVVMKVTRYDVRRN